ncbi:Gastrula zinc finger protein [Lachnellula willkommii]|uniref:Gastrula zinc finger protein n=1 Tax=Lachnellula willkommii TaxID=215461 RepID=A0A559ML48_9HELO|nr:Gastrula zinc finger protein [Lachnellula willkommii]
MEAQSPSTCNQCGKKFQRKAHLLRHQQQHSGDRPYSCKFCSKTFKRSDVLRDHFSRCDRRGNSAIPNSLERGRKRHACDECSRLKVKCDNNVPCRKCKEFGRTCVKSRSTAASSPDESTASASRSTPDPASSDRNSIGFLLNCPTETDFMREFPKSSTLSPNSKPAEYQSFTSLGHSYEPPLAAMNDASYMHQDYGHIMQDNRLDVLLDNLEFEKFEERSHSWQMPGENAMPWSGDATFIDRHVLGQRAYEIREKLKYTAANLHSPNMPPKEILDGINSITADNMAAWVKLYFTHWHKHAPLVHESSFNPCAAAIPLILAVISLGGMYSKESAEVAKLKLLLDTIEAYVYSIPGLSEEYDIPGRTYVIQGENAAPEWQQYQLEELQGAYLMIVVQFWSGSPSARTRVRQSRFQRIYSIFHQLNLQVVQHSPTFQIIDQQSFRSWIRKESYIRTATLATMLDHAFGIFDNVSPRFQWAEIDLPFPSDDVYFKVTNYEELVAQSLYPQHKIKIKDAFLVLFSPPETAEHDLKVLRNANLTALDMQMLIHYLYTCVWKTTFSNPMAALPTVKIPDLLSPFRTAMRNWRTVWDQIKNLVPENEWNKLGFQITAETYFDAVKAIVDAFEKRDGKFPPIPSDCEKGTHLKRLLTF